MPDNETYLIKDFTGNNPTKLRIVSVRPDSDRVPDSLWAELNEAKQAGRKISVYKLGPCVLDWS